MLTALLLLIATPAEVNQTVKVEGKSYQVANYVVDRGKVHAAG